MDLAEAFRNYREKIVGQWVDYTLSTYESSKFFRKEGDKFANPIGGVTKEALDALFLLLAKNAEPETFIAPLEKIMRIRAIQEFAPSQAVSPFHAVKHITRDVLAADKERCHLVKDLYDFDFAVDMAVLAAFDIYMECRERLYSVRIAEIQSGRNMYTDVGCPSALLRDREKEK
ncbi:RsbRD N-terminal domain-containing protein [Desulfopila inferna]|uniref:RsbRD N-terminal domain-containing protein n=1 Tax=Desulfopila inferna TaxID=468528 RepID=UPI0019656AF6|nr:RsbRD N-terminal domain-containing protein [Desulfopila inferna]MBM9606680.1 RsbRD N-terminal domain-containing protein [Desulfopila inferna]